MSAPSTGRIRYESAVARDTRLLPPWDDQPASEQQAWHDLAAAERRQEEYERGHLWPCGCLKNNAGAHRVGCPDHPEGVRG